MLLRVTVHPTNQPAYTLEFFDHDLAREMMRLVATGAVAVNGSTAAHVPIPAPNDVHPAPAPLDEPVAVAVAVNGSSPEEEMPAALLADPAAYGQAAEYCRRVNPLGDMRRVVVATQAAEIYLGASGVSAVELSGLFDAAGWPQPTDFVQAIRNAAREKFGWLERVGNPGYYKVTSTGRAAVLGENGGVDHSPSAYSPPEQGQPSPVYQGSLP